MRLRGLAAVLMCELLLLAGCGPSQPAVPGTVDLPSDISEPLKMVTDEPFSIALLVGRSTDGQSKANLDATTQVMEHLQSCINALGWRLTIQTKQFDFDKKLVPVLQADMAGGGAADGYLVDAATAQTLLKLQLTQDVGPALRQRAPQLYARIQALQSSPVAGIPATLQYWPKFRPEVLYLRTSALQAYGKQIVNATDLMDFLQSGPYTVRMTGGLQDVMDAWAGQMGFYALSPYGLPLFFYARLDDPSCAPVPLEDIEGFDQWFLRCVELQTLNKLQSPYTEGIDPQTSGYFNVLARQMDLGYLAATGGKGKDYTALALSGCTVPMLDASEPVILRMLAVPASSSHAGAVAAFAQWALASPDGYTLCNYGQQDLDYRLVDGRMEYLREGNPLNADDWRLYNQLTLPAAFAFRGTLFHNDDLEHPCVYGAANADDLIAQLQPVQPPIWRARELRGSAWDLQEAFDVCTQPYQEVLSQRYSDFNYMVARINDVPEFSPEQVLAQIRENRPKLDPLILELTRKIKSLLQ